MTRVAEFAISGGAACIGKCYRQFLPTRNIYFDLISKD